MVTTSQDATNKYPSQGKLGAGSKAAKPSKNGAFKNPLQDSKVKRKNNGQNSK